MDEYKNYITPIHTDSQLTTSPNSEHGGYTIGKISGETNHTDTDAMYVEIDDIQRHDYQDLNKRGSAHVYNELTADGANPVHLRTGNQPADKSYDYAYFKNNPDGSNLEPEKNIVIQRSRADKTTTDKFPGNHDYLDLLPEPTKTVSPPGTATRGLHKRVFTIAFIVLVVVVIVSACIVTAVILLNKEEATSTSVIPNEDVDTNSTTQTSSTTSAEQSPILIGACFSIIKHRANADESTDEWTEVARPYTDRGHGKQSGVDFTFVYLNEGDVVFASTNCGAFKGYGMDSSSSFSGALINTDTAFSASFSRDQVDLGTLQTLKFDRIRVNVGNGYDPETGVFTCKIDGLYFFGGSLATAEGQSSCFSIFRNGNTEIARVYTFRGHGHQSAADFSFLYLEDGDRVSTKCAYKYRSLNINNASSFIGALIRTEIGFTVTFEKDKEKSDGKGSFDI